MLGVNINCKELPFVEMILNGEKKIETRDTDSLSFLVGKRVGLVETGNGIAKLKGYATISMKMEFPSEYKWGIYRYAHRVPVGSTYDFKGKKFGYILKDVKRINPIEIKTHGIKWREVPDEKECGYCLK